MKHGEKLAPVAAVVSAVSCVACCLPFGIFAAAGAAWLSVIVEPIRPYLLGVSAALLAFGLWQLYRARGTCRRRTRTSIAIFWVSFVLVAAVALAPQVVGSLLAGGLPGAGGGARLNDLNLDVLKAEFNRAADRTRLIVLFSPT